MKPVMLDDYYMTQSGGTTFSARFYTPDSFSATIGRLVDQIRNVVGGNEVRALAIDKVASPVLQVIPIFPRSPTIIHVT